MKSALLLLCLLPVLSSCLLGKVLVTKLDTVIELRMGHTMQLYVAQDRVLEKDVAAFLNGHRTFVPELLTLVRAIDPKKADLIPEQTQTLLKLYRGLVLDFTRDVLVKTVLTLDKSQRKVFFDKLREQNEELREKLKVGRTEEYHDRMEYFVGDLTDAQLEALRPFEKEFHEQDTARLARREQFQAQLAPLLELQTPDRQARVLAAFEASFEAGTVAIPGIVRFLQELCRRLNKDQREHLEERRQDIIDILQGYAATTYE